MKSCDALPAKVKLMGDTLCKGFDRTIDDNCQLFNLYQLLVLYFRKDKKFLTLDDSYSLDKGLLIQGNIGAGKTMAMTIFSELLRGTSNYYKIVDCLDIAKDFQRDPDILELYTSQSFKIGYKDNIQVIERPITYCFDDLGYENTQMKRYGNVSPIMETILLSRYKYYKQYGMKTFIITNEDTKGIKDAYGSRIVDRLREMCNQVKLDSKSLRQ